MLKRPEVVSKDNLHSYNCSRQGNTRTMKCQIRVLNSKSGCYATVIHYPTNIRGIILLRHGSNSLGHNVRDISHKHEGIGWQLGYFSELARFLDCLLQFQLSFKLELNRFYPWPLTMVFRPNASAHFLPSNKVESIPSIESPT
uniref:Uncharacterized protein n=1 Tax=Cucumis melo TaxID=3656 RepID=A0A9I9E6A0_CUCME